MKNIIELLRLKSPTSTWKLMLWLKASGCSQRECRSLTSVVYFTPTLTSPESWDDGKRKSIRKKKWCLHRPLCRIGLLRRELQSYSVAQVRWDTNLWFPVKSHKDVSRAPNGLGKFLPQDLNEAEVMRWLDYSTHQWKLQLYCNLHVLVNNLNILWSKLMFTICFLHH